MKVAKFFVLTSFIINTAYAHKLDSYAEQAAEYDINPVTRYVDKATYQKIINETNKENLLMESRIYTINTLDQEGCQEFRNSHQLEESICERDPANPLVSLIFTRQVEDSKYFEKRLRLNGLSKAQKEFFNSSVDFSIMGIATFGALYIMPESISKWDKSRGFAEMASKYSERVKEGPVWDKDDWVINYIGHPLSGAFYYTMVRHRGLSIGQSTLFSVVMSTFFWEYGIEAFAETPSIQDLIFTPLLGAILGEVFYQWAVKIDANEGKLLGSEKLAKTAKIMMNPAGSLANVINNKLGVRYIKEADFSLVTKKLKFQNDFYPHYRDDDFIGIQVKFNH